MTEAPATLVTPRMRELQGVWSEPIRSHPIEVSDIRKWALATYWPEQPPRIYWDEDYARTTRWGGIIAPRDFNPFAWPLDRPPTMDFWAIDAVLPLPPPAMAEVSAGSRGMNGGQVDTFGVVLRPGDVATQQCRLLDWKERETRLGLTMFTRAEHRWVNQRGELIKQRVNTLIRY